MFTSHNNPTDVTLPPVATPKRAVESAPGIRKIRDDPPAFEVRVSTGRHPVTGRYGQWSKTVVGTLKQAKTERARMLATVADRGRPGSSPTVSQLLDEFLADRARRGRSRGTIYNYSLHADRYVRPGLGRLKVSAVERRDVARLLAALADDGLSPFTLRQVKTLLSSAFTFACQSDYRSSNPVTYVGLPPVPDAVPACPTPEQVSTLIRAASASSRPEMARFFFLAATTGSRRGEMCGWRRSDIEAAGVLTIGRSILNVPGHTRTEKTTKSRRRRPLAVDPVSLGVMESQLVMMTERAAPEPLVPDPFLFSDALDGSVPWRPDMVTHYFARIRAEVGLDHLVFKGFRKWMTTYGQQVGGSLSQVALRAGNDPAVAARHYTGRVAEADMELARAVAALLPAP